ncbi:amidohydrolase family protein [Hoeflea sp.]|uniref:amidohydrolase family protein n=1 Tax=Hoeflea sp. TaxID=1940281 RepID=UPI003B01B095
MKIRLLPIVAMLLFSTAALAVELPIFDAHIHYSHDAVELVPPEEVAKILRDAGIKKALVSSSDDDGTQKLKAAAPEIIVPALRPYRRRGELGTWMHDPTVIDYLNARLSEFDYEAIGEFHAYGNDIETPVIQQMIGMARDRNLILHHHGDREALDLIFDTWPEARVLWAHSGFEGPQGIADALETYPRLWSDLALRSGMASLGAVREDWRELFMAYPDRFVLGTDTFAPERWYYVGSHAETSRNWLADLPDDVARKIAFENAEAMIDSK